MTSPPRSEDSPPLLTRTEMRVIYVVALLGLLGLGIVTAKRLGYWPGVGVTVLTVGPKSEPLDLNTAQWWELATLPDIGPKRAQAIVQARHIRKGFRSLDELTQIPGIGPQLVQKLKPLLKVGPYQGESRE